VVHNDFVISVSSFDLMAGKTPQSVEHFRAHLLAPHVLSGMILDPIHF
jgi:hypothetical protein